MTWRVGPGASALIAILIGIVLSINAPASAAPASQGPTDAGALARGQEIYGQVCAVCHGVQGRGDGPLARTMVPRPADFRVHMAEGHTPDQLFDWTSNGVPDTAMQGFSDDLSVEDRWNVINYLQTFAPTNQ